MIETTRTAAGYNLYNELCKTMHFDAALDEVRRRVEVRAERVNNDMAHVWTRTDGGAWLDEGQYAVAPLVEVVLPAESDMPWDDDLADSLSRGR